MLTKKNYEESGIACTQFFKNLTIILKALNLDVDHAFYLLT